MCTQTHTHTHTTTTRRIFFSPYKIEYKSFLADTRIYSSSSVLTTEAIQYLIPIVIISQKTHSTILLSYCEHWKRTRRSNWRAKQPCLWDYKAEKKTHLMRTDMRRPFTTVKRRGIIAVTYRNYTYKRSN